MTNAVLDASAVLTLLMREPGWEKVVDYLGGSCISSINLSEVLAKLVDSGMSPEEARQLLFGFPSQIIPFDADHAFRAARLQAFTPKSGLSLGDRACLSLGRQLGVPVVTADCSWADCNVGVQVICIS